MQLITKTEWFRPVALRIKELTGADIAFEGNIITIPEDVGVQDIANVAQVLTEMSDQLQNYGGMLQYNVGRTILDMCSRMPERTEPEELIDQLDLPKRLNKSARTIMNWVWVARSVPSQIIPEGLSYTHVAEVAVRAPSDPAEVPEWNEKRKSILEEAAKEPDEKGAKWVREQMAELKPKKDGKAPSFSNVDLFIQHFRLSRKLEDLTEDWFLANGYKDGRRSAADRLQGIVNELVLRKAVSADSEDDSLPWEGKDG